jgi:hypothetical protein
MTDDERWMEDGQTNGWVMPAASWWKRILVVRRLRAMWFSIQVERHNRMWRSIGSIPTGYDSWVIYGIATGKERPHD